MMLTEHEMLVTLATMALRMGDLTGHDVVEALKAHGFGGVVAEAREPESPITNNCRLHGPFDEAWCPGCHAAIIAAILR